MAANIRAGRAIVEVMLSGQQKFKSDLDRASVTLKKFGKTASGVGKNLLKLGVAAAAPLALATKVFVDFDDKMRAVQAITGATTEGFERLTAEAKRLGSTTRFSASEAAEGMKFLGMAGFTTEQILAGIPAVLNLAAAGAVELGVAADIVSDVGSAFGITADEIGRVSDVIAQTASSANTSIEMMGESFKFVAPIAKAAGQSLEETSAAIGLLGNSGIKASSAGTQLTEIMANMGGAAKDKLGDMGIAVKNADGSSRKLLDVMNDLGDATRDMDPLDRLNQMMDLFGKRGGRAAIVLADAGNATEEMRDKMASAAGRAAEMAATMEGGIGGAFRSLKSAVEGAGIAMGAALAPMLTIVAGLIKHIAQFMAANAGLAKVLAVVSLTLLTGGAVLLSFGAAMTFASFAAAGFTTVMAVLGGVVAFLTSPVVLLIALIGALATALLMFSGVGSKLRKKFNFSASVKGLDPVDQKKATADEKEAAELRLKSAQMLKDAVALEGEERNKQRAEDLTKENQFDDIGANLGKNMNSENVLGSFSPGAANRMADGIDARAQLEKLVDIHGGIEAMRILLEKAKIARLGLVWGT